MPRSNAWLVTLSLMVSLLATMAYQLGILGLALYIIEEILKGIVSL